jgi:septum formation protein
MADERIILASASARRNELLMRIYPAFDVQPCPFREPERRSRRVQPQQWASAVAYFKARSVAERQPGRWVLGADTLVACDGELLGKPRDRDDARRMLELQTRRVSDVITGVCLVRSGDSPERLGACDVTRVWMRDDPAAREQYLRGSDWDGKAGAYGIQNVGDRLVARIEGSFSNVVGLPLPLVARMLHTIGIPARMPPDDGFVPGPA